MTSRISQLKALFETSRDDDNNNIENATKGDKGSFSDDDNRRGNNAADDNPRSAAADNPLNSSSVSSSSSSTVGFPIRKVKSSDCVLNEDNINKRRSFVTELRLTLSPAASPQTTRRTETKTDKHKFVRIYSKRLPPRRTLINTIFYIYVIIVFSRKVIC